MKNKKDFLGEYIDTGTHIIREFKEIGLRVKVKK